MRLLIFFSILSFLFPAICLADPHIETVFEKNNDQLLRAKIINKTKSELACYLAIDGYKIKFRLPPFQASKWFKATDIRYSYKDFSSWCDYIENHPEFKKYDIQL